MTRSAPAVPLSLLLLTLGATPARAMQPLDAFLAASHEGSLERRQTAQELAQRQKESEAARRSLLPVVTARGSYTHNQWEQDVTLPLSNGQSRTAVLTPKHQLDASLTAESQLLDFSRWEHIRAQAAHAEAAQAQLQATTLDVEKQVARAFYDVLTTRAVEAVSGRTVQTEVGHLATARSRKAAGTANDLEVLRATAAAEGARQSLAAAVYNRAVAERRLTSISGLAPEPGGAMPPDDLHEEAPLESFLRLQSPKVRAAELEAEAKGHEARSYAYSLLPAINTQIQERFTNATGFADQTASFQGMIALSWRLDVGAFAQAGAQRAAEAIERTRAARSAQDHRDELFADWMQVQAQIANCRAALANEESSRLADQLARVRYEAGTAQQIDLLQADRDAFSAEVSRIQAEGDLRYARAALRISAAAPLGQEGADHE